MHTWRDLDVQGDQIGCDCGYFLKEGVRDENVGNAVGCGVVTNGADSGDNCAGANGAGTAEYGVFTNGVSVSVRRKNFRSNGLIQGQLC